MRELIREFYLNTNFMKLKNTICFVIFFTMISSCDRSMLINVNLNDELANQNYALIDYSFTLANDNGSDTLYLEFISNKKLNEKTTITFYDQLGNIIDISYTGLANNLNIDSSKVLSKRSYTYSVKLDGLRSVSLINGVMIGN